MKRFSISQLLPLIVLLTVELAQAGRPNVAFLLSDDQGWNDYGFMGHPHLQTPNLDQLARAGLVYERGYVTAPLCRPSLASNIDIATTILQACGIEPPPTMEGLDLRDPAQLQDRDRVFVDVYEHDSDLDQLDDLDSGLVARVVIDGWDKLIARPNGDELYNLETDPDDRTNLASDDPGKVQELAGILHDWISETPQK